MPKTFYTERDIEDMLNRGVMSLVLNDDIVLTDLGRELALKRGMRITRERPSPAAQDENADEVIRRVKEAVVARLGDRKVDMVVLDEVIARVVKSMMQ